MAVCPRRTYGGGFGHEPDRLSPQAAKVGERGAARLAREDGVSLNQWIATAVAEKIGAVEATAEFQRRRATGATAIDLLRAPAGAPDRQPPEDDRAD